VQKKRDPYLSQGQSGKISPLSKATGGLRKLVSTGGRVEKQAAAYLKGSRGTTEGTSAMTTKQERNNKDGVSNQRTGQTEVLEKGRAKRAFIEVSKRGKVQSLKRCEHSYEGGVSQRPETQREGTMASQEEKRKGLRCKPQSENRERTKKQSWKEKTSNGKGGRTRMKIKNKESRSSERRT